jgi:Kdo2-lipid IVA lauroyltransferase/acyltransferase
MIRVLALLPLPLLYAFFAFVAWVLRVIGWRRDLVEQGLARCLPELGEEARHRTLRQFYVSLGRLAAEFAHGLRISPGSLEKRMRFENPELILDALRADRRVMLISAHHCNWEWLLLRCSTAFDEPLVAAYKPARSARANGELLAIRSRFGATMIPANDLVQHLVAQRGQVRLLAMLADQSPPRQSEQQCWLPFFGLDTAFYRGPGWISAKMGYEPFFIAVRPDGRGRYVVRFVPLRAPGERPEPDRVLRAYVHALEQQVMAHPAQYFWAYNRWKRPKRLYD